jgi:sigma-B regulation protein RsbU (phosphoserine phosphatase)
MSKRVWLLLILAAATITYRGLDMYKALFNPNIEWAAGFFPNVDKNGLMVYHMWNKTESGQPTAAAQAGLKIKDRIVAIYDARGQGKPILSFFDYGSMIKTIHHNEPWTLVVSRAVGPGPPQELRLAMPPAPASAAGIRSAFLNRTFSIVLPLLAMITAFFIGFMKPEDDNAFIASLLFLSFSSLFSSRFDTMPIGFREFAFIFNTTLDSFVTYLFVLFFLRFPSPSLIERKAPWLKIVFLVVTIINWLHDLIGGFIVLTSFERYQQIAGVLSKSNSVLNLLFLVMFLTGLSSLILNTARAQGKDDRRRMVILLMGTLVGLLPLIGFVIYTRTSDKGMPSWWIFAVVAVTLAIFPLSFVYVVVKHRVLGIRLILRRGLRYMLISRGFRVVESILIFIALYFLSKSFFIHFAPGAGPLAVASYTALVTLGAVAGLHKINRPVMHAIDRRFFREAYNAQQVLTDLSRAVRRLAAQPDKLLQTITDKLSDSLYPDQVAIFLRGAELIHAPAAGDHAGKSLIKFNPQAQGEYQCHWLRLRSGLHDGSGRPIEAYGKLTLPADAFVTRYLEEVVADEPEALEVYMDNPKSWVNALTKANSQADSRYQEKALLERLNTRLIVPLATADRVLGFICLGEKLSEEPYSKEDKELLLTVAEHTAIALDYAQLIHQVAEQEKLKREIEIAQEVQAHLFPQTLPPIKTLDYTGICKAARGVGGDYYDFLSFGPDKLGIALGDISGKGISAALLMASLQALLRSHAHLYGDALDELISNINRLMCDSTGSSKYATFFYGLYDEARGALTYVNAGHNPPMLFRPNRFASDQRFPSGPVDETSRALARPRPGSCETIRLETGGTVVGLFADAAYQHETVSMRPNDVLLIFTDGISEAMNVDEEEFGEARLAALVADNMHLSAAALRDRILSEITDFVGEAPQHDDMTLVVVKII